MQEIQLETLLKNPQEQRDIDYKATPYDLSDEKKKALFIKDILAMANTPRQGSAYIIIGVKLHCDKPAELLGVSEHNDDADLQQIMNKVNPNNFPTFFYRSFMVDGKSYGVIEIPPYKEGGPFYPKKDFNVIKADKYYFRRGTRNDESKGNKDLKEIFGWFEERPSISTGSEQPSPIPVPNWDRFARACHHFDQSRRYCLIIGPNARDVGENSCSLARLPLSLVLDFDQQTQENGVFAAVEPVIKQQVSLHLWTKDNQSEMVPGKACYWYAARGLQGRQTSLVRKDSWREWNRSYANQELPTLIQYFAKATDGRPLTVISLWYAPEYIREICGIVDRTFADQAKFVFAVEQADRYQDLASQFDGNTVSITLLDILRGIEQNISPTTSDYLPVASIPTASGLFQTLDESSLRWLEEDMQILHSNIEINDDEEEESDTTPHIFLRGKTITWQELDRHVDVDRDRTSNFERVVDNELKSRSVIRLNLNHWPGAGGTTVARRIAWDFRRQYPVVLLRRITPRETVNRLRELFRIGSLSILVIVEAADITSHALDRFYNEVKAENIPCVFLSVVRRFDAPRESPRSWFLDQPLSQDESRAFTQTYATAATWASEALMRLSKLQSIHRTPFHYAITAFGKDFVRLDQYIGVRINNAKTTQREILTLLSLAYYYGHKPTLSQVFAVHLGQPENRVLRLERILEDEQLELLVEEGDCFWRPMHQVVASEIIAQVLTGEKGDRRNWKHNLAPWGIMLISLCADSAEIPSATLIEFLIRIFILRDEDELLGTEAAGSSRYSQFIEDIPTDDGKLSILQALVECFPNEAHFWGHLGRFQSYQMGNTEQAIFALEKAMYISPKDSVLFHMKGMCRRKQAYQLIDSLKGKDPTKDDIENLQKTVDDALDAFDEARELNPASEHTLISPVQMLLRILDFGYQTSDAKTHAQFFSKTDAVSQWYREILDEIEYLLDEARRLRQGNTPSYYLENAETNVRRMYDDYSTALQGWQNLLGRRDVYAPPIRRQIARTYLERSNRDWKRLPQNEIERIAELMEDNLREEPDSTRNLRMWFRAYRNLTGAKISLAIDRFSQWSVEGDNLDAHYYLYILHSLNVMDKAMLSKPKAERILHQCRQKARFNPSRTRSYEWLGNSQGIQQLVHVSELGDWPEEADFFTNTTPLKRVNGHIVSINGPEAGNVELEESGLEAFFVPSRTGAVKGRNENDQVDFYLGFSYEGLRAWSVHLT